MSQAATPIINRIEANLVALLGSITRANGYEMDASVERKAPEGTAVNDYQILVEVGPEEPTPADAPLGCDAYAQTFNLYLFAFGPERADETVDMKQLKLAAAIKRAVGNDTNYTFGGYAHNFRWGTATPVNKGSVAARELPLIVHYRTLRGNPYQR